jgi:hypothetical protein
MNSKMSAFVQCAVRESTRLLRSFLNALVFLTSWFILGANAQSGSFTVDTPWSGSVTPTAALQLLTGSSVEIPGQAQTVNLKVLTLTPPWVISATYPTASTLSVSGFRLKGSATASWTVSYTLDQMLQSPIPVPAGGSLAVNCSLSVLGTAPCTWTVTSPPPPPPTGCVPSAIGSQITGKTGEQLTLKDCTVWTVVIGGAWPKVLRNGVDTNQPYEQKFQYLYVSPKGFADVMSPANGSLCWISGKWTGSGC